MRMLIIAPHTDEVLGCGGMISRNLAECGEAFLCVITAVQTPVNAFVPVRNVG
jgi:LmbE family N-acetylglucosaminyl deacetylase